MAFFGKRNPLEGMRVLIVDNDKRLTELLREIMEALGFMHIHIATDGTEALRTLRGKAVDLIVCDWLMEPMDGITFTEYMRQNSSSPDPFVPIIMLSGRAERHDIEIARDAGVTEFLAKPFTVEALRKHIISVIDRPREFVMCEDFTGPSRRRRDVTFEGPDRRWKA